MIFDSKFRGKPAGNLEKQVNCNIFYNIGMLIVLCMLVCTAAKADEQPALTYSGIESAHIGELRIAQALPEDQAELAKKYYREARSMYREKRYDDAENLLHQALKLDPEYSAATRLLNRVEEKKAELAEEALKEQQEKAEEKEREIINIQNGQIDNLLDSGIEDYRNDEYDSAINKFQAILAMDPENRSAQRYLSRAQEAKIEAEEEARLAAEKEAEEKRQAELERQEKELEEKINSAYNSAYEAYKDKDWERAINGFNEVLALDPENSRAQRYQEKATALSIFSR